MDLGLYHALNGLAGESSVLDHVLRWAAQDLPFTIAIVIVAAWFWPGLAEERATRQRLAVYSVTAALLGLAVAQVISHLWLRDRPYLDHTSHLLIAPSGDPSFPSDHAVGGFGLAMPFVFARRRTGWLLLALAVVMSLARVAVGTHYPTDVLGGAVIGTAAAGTIWQARSWLEIALAPCFDLAKRLRLA